MMVEIQTSLGYGNIRIIKNVKRKLKPDEYSADRKKALEEINGCCSD